MSSKILLAGASALTLACWSSQATAKPDEVLAQKWADYLISGARNTCWSTLGLDEKGLRGKNAKALIDVFNETYKENGVSKLRPRALVDSSEFYKSVSGGRLNNAQGRTSDLSVNFQRIYTEAEIKALNSGEDFDETLSTKLPLLQKGPAFDISDLKGGYSLNCGTLMKMSSQLKANTPNISGNEASVILEAALQSKGLSTLQLARGTFTSQYLDSLGYTSSRPSDINALFSAWQWYYDNRDKDVIRNGTPLYLLKSVAGYFSFESFSQDFGASAKASLTAKAAIMGSFSSDNDVNGGVRYQESVFAKNFSFAFDASQKVVPEDFLTPADLASRIKKKIIIARDTVPETITVRDEDKVYTLTYKIANLPPTYCDDKYLHAVSTIDRAKTADIKPVGVINSEMQDRPGDLVYGCQVVVSYYVPRRDSFGSATTATVNLESTDDLSVSGTQKLSFTLSPYLAFDVQSAVELRPKTDTRFPMATSGRTYTWALQYRTVNFTADTLKHDDVAVKPETVRLKCGTQDYAIGPNQPYALTAKTPTSKGDFGREGESFNIDVVVTLTPGEGLTASQPPQTKNCTFDASLKLTSKTVVAMQADVEGPVLSEPAPPTPAR